MAWATPKLSLSTVEDLKGKGFSQSQIAESFGVTRQYVSWIKHTYGGRMTPREKVLQEWPWTVSADHCQSSPYKNMRNHGEFVATGGVGMSADKLKRLRAFYKKLRDENVVLEYNPDIPPDPGVSNKGGFAYRLREPADEDLLIRVNKHTHITEEGRRIWRFPTMEP